MKKSEIKNKIISKTIEEWKELQHCRKVFGGCHSLAIAQLNKWVSLYELVEQLDLVDEYLNALADIIIEYVLV